MKQEHMYLSLLIKLDESNRLSFQSRLCHLRDAIAETHSISIQEVQDDFESMTTCAKHAFPVDELLDKYPALQSWFCFYRNERS